MIFRHVVVNFISVVSVCWISMIVITRVYDFHTAYIHFVKQVDSEGWLYEHCSQDAFFKNMQYHTDVCEQVVQNRDISPALYALNFSFREMKLCGITDCRTFFLNVYAGGTPVLISLVLLYIFTPSFLLPMAQAMYDQYEHKNLMKRCNPTYNRNYGDAGILGERIKYV